MTTDSNPSFSISNAAEFETALEAVFEAAVHADVDVRGAWEFQTGSKTHNWEVNVSELDRDVTEE